jgi:hypothetical protein
MVVVRRSWTRDFNIDLLAFTERTCYLFSGTVETVAEGVVVTLNVISL